MFSALQIESDLLLYLLLQELIILSTICCIVTAHVSLLVNMIDVHL